MHKNMVALVSLCVVLLSFACLPASTPTPTPPPDPDDVATIVAATLTAMASSDELIVGTEPPEVSTESPSTCLPAHPGIQYLAQPIAVASGEGDIVTFTNIQGSDLGSRPLTGISWMDEDQVHLAGTLAQGATAFPVVFFSLQNNGTLKSNTNNQVSDIVTIPNVITLSGAEGTSFLAFVAMDMMAGWTNRVFAGDISQLSAIQPILTWTPPQQAPVGNAIQPLAVRFDGGQGRGLWFTYTMEGIGNVNFPPYTSLSYLDFSNTQVTTYIDGLPVGGISPDQTLVAFAPQAGNFTGLIQNVFTIRNLITCQEINIPLHPSSNLGAGYMTFSPDNQFIAWLESSGPDTMSASFRLRVATMDGTIIFDSPASNLNSFLGGEPVNFPRPVGWLSNHVLAMEIYSNTLNQSYVVIWAPDPAQPLDPILGANQSAMIAEGTFLGFLYP